MPEGSNAGDGASPPWSLDLRGTTAPALVEVRRWASRTLAQVDDSCPDPPVIAVPSLERLGGRGMQIVDKLADAWGMLPHPGGSKPVWAEVSCDGLDAIPCAAVARNRS
ncbi:hypothetical protein [Amycolatopsis sp. CA-126428]|uniref:hypothetical protein n=1 Tax=Amycolatopsis sp. CA-126428 TaxID=2073158 RepID=UPI000CD04275|nr:hypothetical protein [Amycolatopsis sp. CA-126428]